MGVAMGSGAAYGYAIIGLLKVFEREGIPIDLVAGTSMGALLGSFFCSGLSPDQVQPRRRVGLPKTGCAKTCSRICVFQGQDFSAAKPCTPFYAA